MFNERLKIARKKKGWSLRELATQLNNEISAQALGKYERDEMKPGSAVLLSLSKVLDVSVPYLVNSQGVVLRGVEFRKKASASAKEQAQVKAEVLDAIDRYIQIEQIHKLDSSVWTRPFPKKIEVCNAEDVEKAAIEVRKKWELGIEPIRNVTAMLEDRGLKVLVMDLPDSVHGMTCDVNIDGSKKSIQVIIVNANVSLERRRLTLLNELGHALLNPVGVDERTEEKLMHRFGAAMLCPAEHLEREVGKRRSRMSVQEIMLLKRLYRISGAALLVRLRDVGIIDEQTMTYAFMTFASGWRSNEEQPIEGKGQQGKHELATRFQRLVLRALAEDWIGLPKAAELLRKKIGEVEQELKGTPGEAESHRQ